jgi:hypothetical protein
MVAGHNQYPIPMRIPQIGSILPPEALTLFPVFEEISYISPPLK